jgi:hypothetical protein
MSTLPAPSIAQEACPLNSFSIGQVVIVYQEAARDTGFNASGGSGFLRYDLLQGLFQAGAGADQGGPTCEVAASDEYTLSGPLPATSFTIRARLMVSAQVDRSCTPQGHCSEAAITVVLREGAANEAVFHEDQAPATRTIEVTIRGTAGVPFTVSPTARAHAQTNGGPPAFAFVTAQLDFVGLPSGSSITSCQGYRLDAPVATTRSTWGRVKAHYR